MGKFSEGLIRGKNGGSDGRKRDNEAGEERKDVSEEKLIIMHKYWRYVEMNDVWCFECSFY